MFILSAFREERAKKNDNVSNAKKPKSTSEPEINKPVDVYVFLKYVKVYFIYFSDTCRIQCKFPDGSTLVKSFSSRGLLQEVVDSIKEVKLYIYNFFI